MLLLSPVQSPAIRCRDFARLQFRGRHSRAQSRRRPGRQACLYRRAPGWTYGALAERVDRFGNVLRGLGVRREERVLICLSDSIDWPTAFLGAIKAGIVPVPVNTLLTADDYRFMLEDSRARVLVVSEALFPKFAAAAAASADLAHIIVSGANAHGHLHFEDLLAGASADPVTAPTVRDEICSGSTRRARPASRREPYTLTRP